MNRHTGLLWFAVLFMLANAGCKPSATNDSAGGGNEVTAKAKVKVVKVKVSDVRDEVEVPASFYGFQMADLMSKVDGYVLAVNVDIGDHVSRGQILAELRAPELLADVERKSQLLEQAKKEAASYESQIGLAEANRASEQAKLNLHNLQMKSAKQLVESGALNEQKLDEAKFAVASSEAAIVRAGAEVTAAEKEAEAAAARVKVAIAEQQMVQTMADYLHIKAPFDGLITKRNVDAGAFVEPASGGRGTALFQITAVDQVRVVMHVPMRRAGRLNESNEVTIGPIERLPGKTIRTLGGESLTLSRIARSFDSSRMMRAEVDIENEKLKLEAGFELKPNDYGLAKITLKKWSGALTVPKSAIATQEKNGKQQSTVVVVDHSTNSCFEEEVEVLIVLDELAAIKSDNIKEGDRVVVSGREQIKLQEVLVADRIEEESHEKEN